MDIVETIERLDKHVEGFYSKKDVNIARKAGEALCKIILLNYEQNEMAEHTKYEALIQSISYKNINISKLFGERLQSELKILQTYGNAASHDGGEQLSSEDLLRINQALVNLLKMTFDTKDQLNIDQKTPSFIYKLLNVREAQEENWRCQQIISSIYPNRTYLNSIKDKDYEFHVIQDADSRHLGFISLNRNIAFSQALSKCLVDENLKNLTSLTFLFPLEISNTTKTPVKNRKEYIQKTASELLKNHPKISCSYEFYEDYIWDKCLPSYIKRDNSPEPSPYFIDQKLHLNNSSHLSLEFVDSLTRNYSATNKPLSIIFGQGGVGKTTFCEQAVQKINTQLSSGIKRKAIFISSIDIPEDFASKTTKISSIEDLYSLVFSNDDELIDRTALALNISCGNLIIIIDGLDEIISKLKDKFSISDFFSSIKRLNDTYFNCKILITSREIEIGIEQDENIDIYFLRGFDENLITKYLRKRFRSDEKLIDKADENIKNISSTDEITPLIIRLICDLTEDDSETNPQHEGSRYLKEQQPLDKVLLQIISREIKKQSLSMNTDQYFEMLKSIAFEHKGKISKEELREIVEYIVMDNTTSFYKFNDNAFKGYLSSPLFQESGNEIRIRYDSIEFLIKARYITNLINTHNTEKKKDNTIRHCLAHDCFKGGSLVKEIVTFKEQDTDFEKNLIREVISSSKDELEVFDRKVISALLYIFFEKKGHDRMRNSAYLTELFGESRITGISIFGDFYPIDFCTITVSNGHFDGFGNLSKSSLPSKQTVFDDCKFINFSKSGFGKNVIHPENFNVGCEICQELQEVLDATEQAQAKKIENTEENLMKIFKVGFKNGNFIWKSLELHKQQCASIKTRHTLISILTVIEQHGIVIKEKAKDSVQIGYRVNGDHALEVKDFLTQNITGKNIIRLIENINSL